MISLFDKLPRWLVWEIAVPLTILNGWLLYQVAQTFRTPLTLLTAATLLAFLLSYPAELLQKRGLGRGPSVLVIFLLAAVGLVVAAMALMPVLLGQLQELAQYLPGWLASSGDEFQVLDQWLMAHGIAVDTSELVTKAIDLLPEELEQLPDQLLQVVLGAADSLVEVIATAVLALYLMLHGHEFWQGLVRWLPGDWGHSLRLALRQQFKNYFVGQAVVASLMGLTLTLTFWLLGIPYWLVLGLGIGGLVLIPFGDVVGILAASLLISLQSLQLGGEVLLVSLVIDQIIDNGIAPRILGNLVGVNPVWVILSLLIGAQFGGVLGLVIAVPLAGTTKQVLDELIAAEPDPLSGARAFQAVLAPQAAAETAS
jgi:predicted PurR-regulated permease PerM